MTDAPERIWAGNWLADVGETSVWDIGEWRDEPWQTVGTVEYVIKEDYDALAAKLAEVEAERDHWEAVAIARQARGIVIAQKLDAAEAALPAVYRLGLAAGAKLAETHFVDAGVTGQREHTAGQIIAAAIRATSTPTAAELMARINEGEKK